MKPNSIIFRADPRIASLLRETATATDRTMTDLIESALHFYLEAGPGEYHDKAPRPLPIYFMLGSPDACFYNVGIGENTVSGLFEGTAKDFSGAWHTITGIEWEVSFQSFLLFAYQNGAISDYDDSSIWLSSADDAKEYNARQWATDWLHENVATELFYKVLAAAYKSEWEVEESRLASSLTDLTTDLGDIRPARLWDADLKTATLTLAGLFRACEGWPIQGV